MKHIKLTILAAALSTAATCHAQTFQATAPAPAPDPSAQQSLSTAAKANGTASYNAGMATAQQVAYSQASRTAGDLASQYAAQAGVYEQNWRYDQAQANSYSAQAAQASAAAAAATDDTLAQQYRQQAQDAGAQAGYWRARARRDYSTWQVWLDAANQAQGVSQQQSALSDGQGALAQQSQVDASASRSDEIAAAQPTAQSNSAAAQNASNQGSSQSFADIGSQTGVQQGQPTVTNNTAEYITAGAATQALMNGLTTTGFTANKTAYQDAQNAASCGNPYCAAGWMAANAVEQNIANGTYAGNVAAAPVLGTALNVAAAASALKSAKGTLNQISSMTGVQQGQTTGATNTQQALAQTTAQTGVQQGQSATAASTDTSYTTAADAQQNALGAAAQQNQNATVTAAQAGIAGMNAEYSRNAANQIAGYDNAQAQSTGDPTWTQAAGIAQQQVDQQQGIYSTQQNIQDQAIATGNSTATAANAMAPGIGNTLNAAAQNAATTQANTTLQNIGSQTGVSQQ